MKAQHGRQIPQKLYFTSKILSMAVTYTSNENIYNCVSHNWSSI